MHDVTCRYTFFELLYIVPMAIVILLITALLLPVMLIVAFVEAWR